MITKGTAQDSKSSGEIFSKDIPFEIFTAAEINTMKEQISDSEIVQAIDYITSRINQGMHNKTIGWYKQLENTVNEIQETKGRSRTLNEIIVGAKTYLTAANRLQAPKDGRQLHYGKDKSKYVNVNEAFWHDCIGSIYYSFIANLAETYEQKNPHHRNKTVDIYILTKIRKKLSACLNTEETKRIDAKIITVIKLICSTYRLSSSIILKMSDIEKHEAESQLLELEKKHQTVSQLQQLLESTTNATRSIHIRPIILIQFLQSLDYLKKIIAAHNRNHPALKIINEKRQEMIAIIIFQERLLQNFGYDDFIEALHMVIGNFYTSVFNKINLTPAKTPSMEEKALDAINTRLTNAYLSVLPTQCFFDFEKAQFIQIMQFEGDDADIPKPISYKDMSNWRKNYIKSEKKELMLEYKAPSSPANTCENQDDLLNTTLIPIVKKFEPVEVLVPHVILSSLYHLQENNKYLDDSNVFKFFILGEKDREIIYKKLTQYKIEYKEKIDLLIDQTDRRATHHELFGSTTKTSTPISFFRGRKIKDFSIETIINFTALVSGISIFSDLNQEIQAATELMKQSDDENAFIFMKYINFMSVLSFEFQEYIHNIKSYWSDYIASTKFASFEHQEEIILRDLIKSIESVEKSCHMDLPPITVRKIQII